MFRLPVNVDKTALSSAQFIGFLRLSHTRCLVRDRTSGALCKSPKLILQITGITINSKNKIVVYIVSITHMVSMALDWKTYGKATSQRLVMGII